MDTINTISNELLPSAFVLSPPVEVSLLKPAFTPRLIKLSSLTVLLIPKKTEIEGWRLKSCLLVQIQSRRNESLAMTWLEGVAEYGIAKKGDEAIVDLVVSLGE